MGFYLRGVCGTGYNVIGGYVFGVDETISFYNFGVK